MSLVLLGLFHQRKSLRATHAYLVLYSAVLCAWPYSDARFWIPVLPLIVIVIAQGLQPFIHLKHHESFARDVCDLLCRSLALVALVFTSRVTFSGSRFPYVYGSGDTRPAYLTAWSSAPALADDAIAIRRYGMRHLIQQHGTALACFRIV